MARGLQSVIMQIAFLAIKLATHKIYIKSPSAATSYRFGACCFMESVNGGGVRFNRFSKRVTHSDG